MGWGGKRNSILACVGWRCFEAGRGGFFFSFSVRRPRGNLTRRNLVGCCACRCCCACHCSCHGFCRCWNVSWVLFLFSFSSCCFCCSLGCRHLSIVECGNVAEVCCCCCPAVVVECENDRLAFAQIPRENWTNFCRKFEIDRQKHVPCVVVVHTVVAVVVGWIGWVGWMGQWKVALVWRP